MDTAPLQLLQTVWKFSFLANNPEENRRLNDSREWMSHQQRFICEMNETSSSSSKRNPAAFYSNIQFSYSASVSLNVSRLKGQTAARPQSCCSPAAAQASSLCSCWQVREDKSGLQTRQSRESVFCGCKCFINHSVYMQPRSFYSFNSLLNREEETARKELTWRSVVATETERANQWMSQGWSLKAWREKSEHFESKLKQFSCWSLCWYLLSSLLEVSHCAYVWCVTIYGGVFNNNESVMD